MRELLQKNQIQIAYVLFVFFLTYVLMYPPDILVFKKLSMHGIQIMLMLVVIGLIFLFIKVPRLTMVSFLCVAILSFFFKTSTNATINRPSRNFSPTFELTYLKTSGLEDDFQAVIGSKEVLTRDILVIQEYTPLWKQLVDSTLSSHFPYKAELLRIDDFGQVIYSKNPITRVDTISTSSSPSLIAEVKISDEFTYLLAGFYSLPPVHSTAYTELHNRLDELANFLHSRPNQNQLVFGGFNLVTWSEELTSFKNNLHLSESRLTNSSNDRINRNILFMQPVDHIFISDHLDCLNFGPLVKSEVNSGLYGRYQFKINDF